MVYNETQSAVQVLNRELTLTRNAFDRVGAIVTSLMHAASLDLDFGATVDPRYTTVLSELYGTDDTQRLH